MTYPTQSSERTEKPQGLDQRLSEKMPAFFREHPALLITLIFAYGSALGWMNQLGVSYNLEINLLHFMAPEDLIFNWMKSWEVVLLTVSIALVPIAHFSGQSSVEKTNLLSPRKTGMPLNGKFADVLEFILFIGPAIVVFLMLMAILIAAQQLG